MALCHSQYSFHRVLYENFQTSNKTENMAAAAPLFDAAQLTSFFEGQDYMALTNRTPRLQLALEGITVPDDFIDLTRMDSRGSS